MFIVSPPLECKLHKYRDITMFAALSWCLGEWLVHIIQKYLLSICYMPGTVLDAKYIAVNKRKISAQWSLYSKCLINIC